MVFKGITCFTGITMTHWPGYFSYVQVLSLNFNFKASVSNKISL